MRTIAEKYMLEIVGVLLGALAGYVYWKYVGCINGTCAITSKPLNSTLYGGLLGGLLLSNFSSRSQ